MSLRRIRTVIVDDEDLPREGLRLALLKDPDIELLAACKNGKEAIEAIEKYQPDLVMLDIQMPEIDGFDVIRALKPESLPAILFVTAYDTYALEAFEVNAIDYVLKPFSGERIRQALNRVKETIRARRIEELSSAILGMVNGQAIKPPGLKYETDADKMQYADKIFVKTSDRILFIETRNILSIEGEGYYVRVNSDDGSHLHRDSLRSLEQRLDPKKFFRAHKSALVNLDRIREVVIKEGSEYTINFDDGSSVPVSRRRRKELLRLINRKQ